MYDPEAIYQDADIEQTDFERQGLEYAAREELHRLRLEAEQVAVGRGHRAGPVRGGSVTTKREIKQYARDTRESLRLALAALDRFDFDAAEDMATQAARCAGEVENLVQQYVDEHTASRFVSGDSERRHTTLGDES